MSKGLYKKVLTPSKINPSILKARYAVRGAVVDRMAEMKAEMMSGTKFPFDSFTETNIGNPHLFKQKPITFNRQVIAAVSYPELITRKIFSEDVNNRAEQYLETYTSIGSYS